VHERGGELDPLLIASESFSTRSEARSPSPRRSIQRSAAAAAASALMPCRRAR